MTTCTSDRLHPWYAATTVRLTYRCNATAVTAALVAADAASVADAAWLALLLWLILLLLLLVLEA